MTSSATVVAAEVRKGERSARDSVAGALHRLETEQDRLNVATLIDGERAILRAEEIDRVVENGGDPGPLAGVPVALKDLVDHAGRPTTCGSSFYRRVPDSSATVVDRLEAAGAVVVARTGLHEFAFGFSSENQWFGPVRNPLDPATSPGGSSGGSAAAVAAEQVPLAIGTDTGGSVRVPAALCGVLGLKVTHGRVPLTGVFPLAPSLDTVGPLAASSADLGLAYTVMAGYDPADPWSAFHPVVRPAGSPPDLKGVRIGIPVPWVDEAPTTEEVAEAFADVMARIQGLGAEVVEVEDPELAPPGMALELLSAEVASLHRRWWDEGRRYGTEVAERLASAMETTLEDYVAAQAWRARLRTRAAMAFSSVTFLATPAAGATRKVIGEDSILTSHGETHYRPVLAAFSSLVNHMGCPALVAPIRAGTRPAPALQLIAPWWQEHRLLELASTLENAGVVGAVPGVG